MNRCFARGRRLSTLLPAMLALLAMLATAPSLRAQKTDVLTLLNGDRITGEIKSYNAGRVSLDTTPAGIISVKWNQLQSIESVKRFDVLTVDGIHHFGSFAPSDPPGKLTIVSGDDTLVIDFHEVFELNPVYRTFWRRWDGSFDLGFNYTSSSDLTQFNVDAAGTYRMKVSDVAVALSSFFSRQNGVTAADRASGSVRYDRFLPNRWLLQGGFGADRNLQLGLKLRLFAGVGFGRNVIQTNQTQLTPFIGILAANEDPIEGEKTNSAEGIVGARYSYFMYDFPKVTISASVQVYPSITESGRVRLEATASARREIISDLYLSLSIFDSFDRRDPTTGQSRNDWGPTFSVGWQF